MKENEKNLFKAAGLGDVDEMRRLIGAGTDVNARDEWRETPLHTASEHGYPEIVDLLIESGANVNAADATGSTPLHYSSQHGNLKCAKLLIESGADVNARNNIALTPLRVAWAYGHNEIAELLHQHSQKENEITEHTPDNRYKLLKRKEAANFLGLSAGTLAVWKCNKLHDLPVIKVGGSIRYRLSDLKDFLERRTIIPNQEKK